MTLQPTPAALQVRADYPCTVAYVGTREQLLEAGVVVEAMFPDPPARRRWARHRPEYRDIAPDNWTVNQRKDGRWRVTREDGWERPEQIRAEHGRRQEDLEAWRGRYAQQQERFRAHLVDSSVGAYLAGQGDGPQTEEEYRLLLVSAVDDLRSLLSSAVDGNPRTNGYRLAPHAAEELMEQLDQLLADLLDAEVQRPTALDGLATPLAGCLRTAMAGGNPDLGRRS